VRQALCGAVRNCRIKPGIRPAHLMILMHVLSLLPSRPAV
jgi:hypothetical protein